LNTSAFAQKQNNQWRFGTGGAIDFNTVPPSFVAGAAIITGEGSASVADKTTGALLFYTNGVTVWNSLNQVMPNGTGLLGGTAALLSSTTAAVIVPKPGSNSLYYLITIDEQFNGNGIRYSVVDMTLNGGLGDIVAGQKNIFLFQTNSEKLEVVPASDGLSYWLLTHDNPGDTFYSFKIDNIGIQTTPVINQIGGTHGNGAGHMKINKQFNKIAVGNFFSSDIELFDFNNSTGIISNPIIWNFNFPNGLIYGVEFSPDGKVLYVSNIEKIIQYDISQATITAIENSAFQLTSGGFYQPASLQLGVDDKIYINSGAIDAINCPNKLGAACGFQQNVIPNLLGGGGYGLPKWVYYPDDVPIISTNSISYSDSCFGSSTQFSLQSIAGISSVNWLFDDVNSGANNTAIGTNVSHTFSQIGSYDVRAILTTNCGFDTLFLNNLQVVNCTPTTSITGIKIVGDTCSASTNFAIQAIGTSNSPYFFWDFGDPNSGTNDTITITGLSPSPFPTHTFSSAGIYNICVSFKEPGFPVDTVCRTVKIGLCNVNPPPCIASFTVKDSCVINPSRFSSISSSSINSVTWNFDDAESGVSNTSTLLNPIHQFTSEGNFTVTANFVLSCGNYVASQNIQIFKCDTARIVLNEVFIPEAFSPNNDGNNDKLFVRGSIKDFTFSVFNRWGELVFKTQNQITGWDGSFRGKDLDAGVFVYYLTGVDTAGNTINKKGNITLVK
jgi:gliding motility-associated-like protein